MQVFHLALEKYFLELLLLLLNSQFLFSLLLNLCDFSRTLWPRVPISVDSIGRRAPLDGVFTRSFMYLNLSQDLLIFIVNILQILHLEIDLLELIDYTALLLRSSGRACWALKWEVLFGYGLRNSRYSTSCCSSVLHHDPWALRVALVFSSLPALKIGNGYVPGDFHLNEAILETLMDHVHLLASLSVLNVFDLLNLQRIGGLTRHTFLALLGCRHDVVSSLWTSALAIRPNWARQYLW